MTAPAPDDNHDLTLVSGRTGPAGERVLTRLAPGTTVTMSWMDSASGTDVTRWVPDLVLAGWTEASLEADAAAPPADTVEVGRLHVEGTLEVSVACADGCFYVLTPETVADWLTRGISALVTAGVAHEAGDVPGDARLLTD